MVPGKYENQYGKGLLAGLAAVLSLVIVIGLFGQASAEEATDASSARQNTPKYYFNNLKDEIAADPAFRTTVKQENLKNAKEQVKKAITAEPLDGLDKDIETAQGDTDKAIAAYQNLQSESAVWKNRYLFVHNGITTLSPYRIVATPNDKSGQDLILEKSTGSDTAYFLEVELRKRAAWLGKEWWVFLPTGSR